MTGDNDRVVPAESARPIKERIASMFNNEKHSDIYFVVGKGAQVQRIPAHKVILSTGSSVFDTLFDGSSTGDCDEIKIPDVDPTAFLALLRFLYSDEVKIDSETVLSVLYVAKKYDVPTLEAECAKFLQNSLTSSNAFTLLIQARKFDEHELAEKCLTTIESSGITAFAAEGFLDIDLEVLCSVLERDGLNVKEIDLFNAVKRWSAAECERRKLPVEPDNQRDVLERALQLIRFPLMSSGEFSSHVAQSGLLDEKDVISLFVYITSNQKPSIKFNSNPRTPTLVKNQPKAKNSVAKPPRSSVNNGKPNNSAKDGVFRPPPKYRNWNNRPSRGSPYPKYKRY